MKIKSVSIKNFRSCSNETFFHLIIYLGNLLRNADLLEVDMKELLEKVTVNVTEKVNATENVTENVTENYRIDKGGSLYFNL